MLLVDRSLVTRTVAGWGVQLAEAYEHVLRHVGEDETGWFTRPMVHLDIGGHVRLGFLPPEVAAARCEQEALVQLVGTLITTLASPVEGAPPSPITALVEQCREVGPRARYRTLADLRTGLRLAAAPAAAVREGEWLEAWRLDEAGLGWLAAGDATEAFRAFDVAIEHVHYVDLARLGRDLALTKLTIPTDPAVMNSRPSSHSLADAADLRARARLRRRVAHLPRGAGGDRGRAGPPDRHGALSPGAARRARGRGARRAGPGARPPPRRRPRDPGRCAAAAPALPGGAGRRRRPDRPHARRRRRPPRARQVSAGAAALRRGARQLRSRHRAVAAARRGDAAAARGRSPPASTAARSPASNRSPSSIPAHLAHVRDVLVTGRIEDAVALLRLPHHAADPEAQLLLENLLAFAEVTVEESE